MRKMVPGKMYGPQIMVSPEMSTCMTQTEPHTDLHFHLNSLVLSINIPIIILLQSKDPYHHVVLLMIFDVGNKDDKYGLAWPSLRSSCSQAGDKRFDAILAHMGLMLVAQLPLCHFAASYNILTRSENMYSKYIYPVA